MRHLEELIKTIEILRSPEGCEWDRQQTHQTIRQNMLEEAYEAVEAIKEGRPEHIWNKSFVRLRSIPNTSIFSS